MLFWSQLITTALYLSLHCKLNAVKLWVVLHNSRSYGLVASNASNLYSSCSFLSLVQFQVSCRFAGTLRGPQKEFVNLWTTDRKDSAKYYQLMTNWLSWNNGRLNGSTGTAGRSTFRLCCSICASYKRWAVTTEGVFQKTRREGKRKEKRSPAQTKHALLMASEQRQSYSSNLTRCVSF